MATEIERKFLIDPLLLRKLHPELGNSTSPPLQGIPLEQGYLSLDPAVRVRVAPNEAWLTVKGKGLLQRQEFEYNIPRADGVAMLKLCTHKLSKIRYEFFEKKFDLWQVDEFRGELSGLWLAEIELDDAGQPFNRPEWVREEVTHDPRYQNVSLVTRPLLIAIG